jgi:hypothetical protein
VAGGGGGSGGSGGRVTISYAALNASGSTISANGGALGSKGVKNGGSCDDGSDGAAGSSGALSYLVTSFAGLALEDVGPNAVRVGWSLNGNYGSETPGAWTVLVSTLPEPLDRHGAAYYNGRVYISGGVRGSVRDAVYYASLGPDGSVYAWNAGTPLPAPRESHTMTAYGGRLFVTGGFEGTVKSTVWVASILADGSLGAWMETNPLPAARTQHAAAAWGGRLYVSGGDNGVFAQSTVYSAPIASDGSLGSWDAAASLPFARSGHAMTVSSGAVYVSGGVGGEVADTVWWASLASGAPALWNTAASLPEGRTRHAMIATSDRLVVLGGHDGSSARSTVYGAAIGADRTLGSWSEGAAMPGRFMHSALQTGERIVLLGGSDGSAPSASIATAALSGLQCSAERAGDAGFGTGFSSSGYAARMGYEFTGLTPNTAYFFRVKGRSAAGFETGYASFGSTLTLSALPGAAASTFTAVEVGSVTARWALGDNPAGTEFRAQLSTSAIFGGAVQTSDWATAVSTAFAGLVPNTTYYVRAQSRNSDSLQGSYRLIGTTATLADVPSGAVFTSVLPAGITLEWSAGGNTAGTRYEAQLATVAAFGSVLRSSVTLSTSASFSGLLSASTFYARVRALNRGGIASAYDVSASTWNGMDIIVPGISTGTAAMPAGSANALLFSWIAAGDDGYSGSLISGSSFYVQWSTSDPALVSWSTASAQVAVATSAVIPGTVRSLVVGGLPTQKMAWFRIWTKDDAGNYSAPSGTAAAFVSPFAIQTLDGAGVDAGRGVSLAAARAGGLAAAYRGGSVSPELRVIERTGGIWGPVEAPDPGVRVGETLVAVDLAGNPQAFYRSVQTGGLKLAKKAGSWTTSAVAAGNLVPASIVIDGEARAHVVYYDAAGGTLKYSSWTGTGWGVETVDASGGQFASLALDGSRKPHIAYYDSVDGDLKYASRTVSGWSVSTVDGAGVDVGTRAALALDGAGNARIAYIDKTNGDLKYARWDGGAWSIGAVESAGAFGSVGSLVLDGAGNAHLSYYEGAGGELKYGRWTGAAWSTMTVDASGYPGEDSGLALDLNGTVAISYYSAGPGDLKAASWSAGAPSPVAAPSGFQGAAVSSNSIQWSWTDDSTVELGFRLYGAATSTGPFTLMADTSTITASPGSGFLKTYIETGLAEGATYYRYAVAVGSGGVAASMGAATYPHNTVDRTSPTITVNQAGDDLWRRTNIAVYNVDFTDLGGSGLGGFAVRVSTKAGDAWTGTSASTEIMVAIGSDTYTTDWKLPDPVFGSLMNEATSYLSIRVWDGLGNTVTRLDAFYVRKDTTPPVLEDHQSGDAAVRIAAGTLYDVDALDPASSLAKFQYSVSLAPGSGDASWKGWTDIPVAAGATYYRTDWPMDFAGLSTNGTNYVSVRAIDGAGSTTTLKDAFYVLKDTAGPQIAFLLPASLFRSELAAVSGTSSDANGAVGVELKFQKSPPGGNYWDGAGFDSGSEIWFIASGTAAWSLAPGIPWTDGTSYRIVARASDTLNNYSAPYSTADFTMDASSPSAAVTLPAAGSTVTALPVISGTSADPGGLASGVSVVELRLRRNSDGRWWDFFAERWSDAAVSSAAAGTNPWSWTPTETLKANLANGASYFIAVRAVDSAAPSNSGGFAEGTTFYFSDPNPPAAVSNLSALTGPLPGTVDLDWTAPGDDGAAGILQQGYYRIHYSTDSEAAFSTAAAQVVFATASVQPGAWQNRRVWNLMASATYYFRVFTVDDAGNWSTLSNAATGMAGLQPLDRISGGVMKVSSEPIAAVLMDCYDATGLLVASTYTVQIGSFTFADLPGGFYRIQASWTAGEITSSVWQDGNSPGSYGVDFTLEVNYTLSTLTGQVLSMPMSGAARAAFAARVASGAETGSLVDLFVKGRKALSVPVDPSGRWAITNLLPGRYGVRVYNGTEYTDVQDVEVGEGETKEVVFIQDPLPEVQVFAFPNPARTETTLRFYTPLQPLEAQVAVFDIAGALVREIPGSEIVPSAPGVYHARWDLANSRGEGVASGVYLFMVKVKGGPDGQKAKVIKKLAVVK